MDNRIDAIRAKRSRKLPTVLTPDEVRAVIQVMSGVHRLIVQILYGSGLRLQEAMQLRIKDLDFAQQQIIGRNAKGNDSRVTMLPTRLVAPLQEHLQGVKRLYHQDLEQGYGAVILPFAVAKKYPNANRQWIWQFVFPSSKRSCDPRSRAIVRYHLHESGLQKAIKRAVRSAGLQKRIGCHTSLGEARLKAPARLSARRTSKFRIGGLYRPLLYTSSLVVRIFLSSLGVKNMSRQTVRWKLSKP